MGFFEKVKDDSVSVGYRIGAKKLSKGLKTAIVKALKDKNVDQQKVGTISEVLDSDAGDALISIMLGYTLQCMPRLKDDPRAKRLSSEFKIGGMSTAGELAFDVGLKYFLGPINSIMENLPENGEPRFRVESKEDEVEETKEEKVKYEDLYNSK